MIYSKKFVQKTDYDSYKESEGYIAPNVSYCEDTEEVYYNQYVPPPHDYSKDYLTFKALESGTFKLSGNSVDYSLDNGETWTTLASNTNSQTVTAGSKIIWKGSLTPTSNGVGRFSSTGSFEVEGNPMSLLYGDSFVGQKDLTGKNNAFKYLLSGATSLTSAENMSLAATTLSELCYRSMFYNCTSLTTAPELPATTLYSGCYQQMFQHCENLTTAPELPATTLVYRCYSGMFQQCNKLNYIKALFTTTPGSDNTSDWVNGVASSGTFVKNSAATWSVTGKSGIPNGWTVETASA